MPPGVPAPGRGRLTMMTLLARPLGLLLLVLTITVPGCQALFTHAATVNAPQELSPGSFTHGR